MAFRVDVALIVPAILAAMVLASRPLDDGEKKKLRAEIDKDPKGISYKNEDGTAKTPYELAGILNTSGRTDDVLGGVVVEAADIIEVYAGDPTAAPVLTGNGTAVASATDAAQANAAQAASDKAAGPTSGT